MSSSSPTNSAPLYMCVFSVDARSVYPMKRIKNVLRERLDSALDEQRFRAPFGGLRSAEVHSLLVVRAYPPRLRLGLASFAWAYSIVRIPLSRERFHRQV